MRRMCAHRLLLVARSICSSKAVLAEVDHQLIMLGGCCRVGRNGGSESVPAEGDDEMRY
jgi:hypothetical protein